MSGEKKSHYKDVIRGVFSLPDRVELLAVKSWVYKTPFSTRTV